MGNVLVNDAYLYGIADALREKHDTEKKYLPSEMEYAVRGIQSGGEDWFPYVNTFANMFKKVTFPEGSEIVLNIGMEGWIPQNVTSYLLTSIFENTSGLKRVVLKGNPEGILMGFRSSFSDSADLEELDVSGLTFNVQDFLYTFNQCKKLKRIIGELDFSSATNTSGTFNSCETLEEVRLKKESLKMSLSVGACPLLSDASANSVLGGLAYVETAQTLTMHRNVFNRLTEEQKAQATSKNWTISRVG